MKVKIFWSFLGVLIIFIVFIAAAETVKIVVKEAQGRSGPGSFYELKVLIPEGTTLEVIEINKSWYKVKYSEEVVWVSENSLSVETDSSKSSKEDLFKSLSLEDVSVKASPATLTAAIKGFWTRYSRTNRENLAELPVNGYDVPVSYFESFSRERSRDVSRDDLQRKYGLKRTYKKIRIPYEKEHSIGYSIASSIAEGSLVENKNLLNYLYSVGWYIAESTERYDIRFNYYILDTDHINAVSCPGGYVVFTRGLLELINDESELAALLAHEMAHVIAGHAMQSMEESEVSIQADSAFDLLGKETSSLEAEEDLIAITNRAVSIATSPKLDEQEFEADRMAILYLARSGYDLNGLPRMLHTMMNKHESNVDIFDLNYRNHPDFKERIKRVEKEIGRYRRYEGRQYANSFRSNIIF